MDKLNENIILCADGKYRWYYEYPMLKNPVILFTIWKVALISATVPGLIVLLSELSYGFISAIKQFITVFGLIFGIFFILSVVSYLILSAFYGFKYIVLFEMDDNGITHIQQNRQFKKSQAVGRLSMIAGAAGNNPAVMGNGMLVKNKQMIASEFNTVKSVRGLRKLNTIKLNQMFAKNQIYVRPEDYDFVWNYIISHCKNAKIK